MSSQSRKNWSLEVEDEEIKKLFSIYNGKYNLIAKHCRSGKSPKQIRDRYVNHLDPSIDNSPLTFQEKMIILKMAKESHSWSKIQKALPNPGRTTLLLKNFYHNAKRKNQHLRTNPMDVELLLN
ncbi:7457_t:CDS:2 [Ambispora gerdemannii]|uniref:7457_t:CDS:1 n=1 Tax=Ambispora gerdemannii TaxID=144530 RepID=A0A9N8YRZ6_9GLOM|nr:7457_t:CDS:2 [Ambispora gerdemannii]